MKAEHFQLDGPEWMKRAQCGVEFVAFGAGTTATKVAICGRCPVREDCLLDAIENDERFDVWGGRRFGPDSQVGFD